MAVQEKNISVGIVGVSGYTGEELARLVLRHPRLRLTFASSRQWASQPLSQHYPFWPTTEDLVVSAPDAREAMDRAGLLFLALPHHESMHFVAQLDLDRVKVVDLSADFRLRDEKVYEAAYGVAHTAPQLLKEAVYGLCEVGRAAIAGARLVANPGCYPTCAALAMLPLLPLAQPDKPVVVDAKSGVSGAGRTLRQDLLLAEAGESLRPYGVVGHRHTPEIQQVLSTVAGAPVKVSFTPHLLPVNRGMEATCYLWAKPGVDEARARGLLTQAYQHEPFVKVLPPGDWPDLRRVNRTNLCLVNVAMDTQAGLIKVFSTLDNLGKGASGQAVQNANLMLGLTETEGLL